MSNLENIQLILKLVSVAPPLILSPSLDGMQTFTSNLRLFSVLSLSVRK